MLDRLSRLPLIVLLMALGALAMYVPAAHAAVLRHFEVMRGFFQSANLTLILAIMIGIATANRPIRHPTRAYLLALLGAFAGLPLLFALPMMAVVPQLGLLDAWMEMVSDFTTTGMTLFPEPAALPPSVHLWRALVGWLGGALILVAALALLAPMNLGGFEVLAPGGRSGARGAPGGGSGALTSSEGRRRLIRVSAIVLPVYAALTAILWAVLAWLGDGAMVALVHAMSTLSTSGISSIGGVQNASSGPAGEAAILLMLLPALSHRTLLLRTGRGQLRGLLRDPELRLGLALGLSVAGVLFLRHWLAGLHNMPEGTGGFGGLALGLHAFWGTLFTVFSYLTTTGFESASGHLARNWADMSAPGVVLLGLALMGGGVATTAGGVKLLRIFALQQAVSREMEHIIYPSSVGGDGGAAARQLRRQGSTIAWIFFMMLAMTLAAVTTLLSLNGVAFTDALVLAIAALTTTGPLVQSGGESAIALATLSGFSKIVVSLSMVLGRLEMLAIVALLNRGFWRR